MSLGLEAKKVILERSTIKFIPCCCSKYSLRALYLKGVPSVCVCVWGGGTVLIPISENAHVIHDLLTIINAWLHTGKSFEVLSGAE